LNFRLIKDRILGASFEKKENQALHQAAHLG
jgi:hypothetical protein